MKNLIKILMINTLIFNGALKINDLKMKEVKAIELEYKETLYNPKNLFVCAAGIEDDENYVNAIKFVSALPKGTDAKINSNNEYNVGLKFEFDPFVILPESIEGTTFYLKPNENWKSQGARFAMNLSNDNEEVWVDMLDENNDGIYKAIAPNGEWSKIIFCRMNGSVLTNNWDNKWNQTSILTYSPTEGNLYKVENGTWDNGNGTWSFKSDIETKVGYYTCANLSSVKNLNESKVGYEVEVYFSVIIDNIPSTYDNGTVRVTPAYQSKNGDTIYCKSSTFVISITTKGIVVM